MELYLLNVEKMEDPCFHPEWESELLFGRWSKIIRYRALKDRKLGAGAGWLLRKVLLEQGMSKEKLLEQKLTRGVHGKPYLDGIYFNLSHSGDYAICAVSAREVGCDIEKIRAGSEPLILRCFSERERKYLEKEDSPEEKKKRFTLFWTLKESYLKKRGTGLAKDLRQVQFDYSEENIAVYDEGIKRDERFFTKEFQGYQIAVCGEEYLDWDSPLKRQSVRVGAKELQVLHFGGRHFQKNVSL